jgi:hypothetical protein
MLFRPATAQMHSPCNKDGEHSHVLIDIHSPSSRYWFSRFYSRYSSLDSMDALDLAKMRQDRRKHSVAIVQPVGVLIRRFGVAPQHHQRLLIDGSHEPDISVL